MSDDYDAELWSRLVEHGELRTLVAFTGNEGLQLSTDRADDPESVSSGRTAIVLGSVPAAVHRVRVSYEDGRAEEVCTVGRALGLPVVFYVLDLHEIPTAVSGVDSAGRELTRGVPVLAPVSTYPGGKDAPQQLAELRTSIVEGAVELPLQPAL